MCDRNANRLGIFIGQSTSKHFPYTTLPIYCVIKSHNTTNFNISKPQKCKYAVNSEHYSYVYLSTSEYKIKLLQTKTRLENKKSVAFPIIQ